MGACYSLDEAFVWCGPAAMTLWHLHHRLLYRVPIQTCDLDLLLVNGGLEFVHLGFKFYEGGFVVPLRILKKRG